MLVFYCIAIQKATISFLRLLRECPAATGKELPYATAGIPARMAAAGSRPGNKGSRATTKQAFATRYRERPTGERQMLPE
jgi:hypothetical protein